MPARCTKISLSIPIDMLEVVDKASKQSIALKSRSSVIQYAIGVLFKNGTVIDRCEQCLHDPPNRRKTRGRRNPA